MPSCIANYTFSFRTACVALFTAFCPARRLSSAHNQESLASSSTLLGRVLGLYGPERCRIARSDSLHVSSSCYPDYLRTLDR